ncbi:MAG: membrane protein insertion efficiency factor YidD [Pseudomonadota bacterium]
MDSKQKVSEERKDNESIISMVFIKGIKFFQNVISPVDGDRCPMYPTCSKYSIQAFRKHGPFLGFVMTADRLIHERNEMQYAPTVIVNGVRRYYDPVENNDFWLGEK